ncbi:MAG: dihydropteroate synthase [Clostridia bacterium]
MEKTNRKYNFVIGDKTFCGGTHVMSILNVTPDSFFPLSRAYDDVVEKALAMVKAGAEVIDIGGQSTRPNCRRIGALEELSRVIPAVIAVKSACSDVVISVDTFHAEVARQAIEAGASMINDVTGFTSRELIEVVASTGASVCIMHNRRNSKIPDMFTDKIIGLQRALARAEKAGIAKNKILLDGGIGFNKSNVEDWELLNKYSYLMDEFPDYPFLLGTSRKSMFGGDVFERLSATLDSTILATKQGALFVRVHDVAENMAAILSEQIK